MLTYGRSRWAVSRNLYWSSKLGEAASRSLLWTSNEVNELPEVRVEFPLKLIGQSTNGLFNRSIMARTQILVHSWRRRTRIYSLDRKRTYQEVFTLVSSVRKASLTDASFFCQEATLTGAHKETITLTRPFSLYGRNDLPVKLYEML